MLLRRPPSLLRPPTLPCCEDPLSATPPSGQRPPRGGHPRGTTSLQHSLTSFPSCRGRGFSAGKGRMVERHWWEGCVSSTPRQDSKMGYVHRYSAWDNLVKGHLCHIQTTVPFIYSEFPLIWTPEMRPPLYLPLQSMLPSA